MMKPSCVDYSEREIYVFIFVFANWLFCIQMCSNLNTFQDVNIQ